jgi:tetratricopeptide (TPR) repeat protein
MTNTDLLYERASLLLEQGRVEDAMKEVKQLLRQEPNHSNALALLARCHLSKKEHAEAGRLLKEALAIEPNNSFYFYLLAFSEYQQDQYLSAASYLDRAIRLDPYQPEYFGLLAFVLLEERRFEEALAKANEGLALDAEHTTCLNARSRALNKLNRIEDAEETMRDTLAADPENSVSHNTIGWNFLEKGKHREARGHFMEALRLAPDNQAARYGLKESLKSSIPPYKWLLQLSFWLNDKGKNFRLYFFVGIFIAVQVITRVSRASDNYQSVGLILGACYILFVASSWIMNPMANAFLLFHPIGKHALDYKERWNALGFLMAVGTGVLLMLAGLVFANPVTGFGPFLEAGLIAISLCIPLGHMNFPIRLAGNGLSQWLSLAMVLTAIAAIVTVLAGLPAYNVLLPVYFILFVVYSWTSNL